MNKQDKQTGGEGGAINSILSIVYIIIACIAIYLSFKCHKRPHPDLILAFCCSPFYIAYRLAVKCF
jgi:hypothetical protein